MLTKIPLRVRDSFLVIFAVLVSLWPLVSLRFFGDDWASYYWMTHYFEKYFKAHGAFPGVFSTDLCVNFPFPVFYGFLIFPILGTLSVLFHADIAIRVLIFAVFFLQFFCVFTTVNKFYVNRFFAFVVACLLCWEAYPLVNIYIRGALGEFFGMAFLVSAVCCWLQVLPEKNLKKQVFFISSAIFLLTLAMGTHVITAYYGFIYSIFIFIASWPFLLKNSHDRIFRITFTILAFSVFAVLLLGPWLYAMLKFENSFADRYSVLGFWPDSIDSYVVRFFPLPIPSQYLWPYYTKSPNAYLEGQISFPLLVIGLSLFFQFLKPKPLSSWVRSQNFLFMSAFLCFGLATYASLNFSTTNWLARQTALAQFTMRFTGYANLALLISIILGGLLPLRPPAKKLLLFFAVLGFSAALMKSWQGHTMSHDLDAVETRNFRADDSAFLVKPPFGGYFHFFVSTGGRYFSHEEASKLERLDFKVGSHSSFGLLQPVGVKSGEEKWYRTNLNVFPWNQITLNGETVPVENLGEDESWQLIRIPKGTHSLQVTFAPPKIWSFLRVVSAATFIMWLALLSGLWISTRIPQKR